MLSSLLGLTMALVLQQGDVNRQHITQPLICIYMGDEDSIWYQQRHSGKFVTGADWTDTEQYS